MLFEWLPETLKMASGLLQDFQALSRHLPARGPLLPGIRLCKTSKGKLKTLKGWLKVWGHAQDQNKLKSHLDRPGCKGKSQVVFRTRSMFGFGNILWAVLKRQPKLSMNRWTCTTRGKMTDSPKVPPNAIYWDPKWSQISSIYLDPKP